MRPQIQNQIHPDIRSVGFSRYKGVGFIFDLWHKRISWTPNIMLRRQEDEAVDAMMSECWDDWND